MVIRRVKSEHKDLLRENKKKGQEMVIRSRACAYLFTGQHTWWLENTNIQLLQLQMCEINSVDTDAQSLHDSNAIESCTQVFIKAVELVLDQNFEAV